MLETKLTYLISECIVSIAEAKLDMSYRPQWIETNKRIIKWEQQWLTKFNEKFVYEILRISY